MKTMIITVLLLALAGALALTRPTEADFKTYMMGRIAEGDVAELRVVLGTTHYRNYVLWSTIERDGKTLYVGALSRWFVRENLPGKWEMKKSPTVGA